jgi:hypothetical protein
VCIRGGNAVPGAENTTGVVRIVRTPLANHNALPSPEAAVKLLK